MKYLQTENWARTTPTNEGLAYLGLSLFVGFGALNTGNNLLYLSSGIMLISVIASGIVSSINISNIEVNIVPNKDIFALTPTPLKFTVTNKKGVFPSYSINIDMGGNKSYLPFLGSDQKDFITINGFFKQRD